MGQRGCGPEKDWPLSKSAMQGPSPRSLPLWGFMGGTERGAVISMGYAPSQGGPKLSPVRQVSQHDPADQGARHEHRLGHLLQFVGFAHQIPLCKMEVESAGPRPGPDQPSRQCSAGVPTHARLLSQHPHLTLLSVACCFPGTVSPFSLARAFLGLPVAFGSSTHSCIMTASLQHL